MIENACLGCYSEEKENFMRDYLILSPKELDRERLARLQKRMQNRKASICSQRALLYTESFQQTEQDPYILRKAKAFAHTLTHMDIYLEEDSLIFGNQASRNFAAPILSLPPTNILNADSGFPSTVFAAPWKPSAAA